MSTDWLSRLTDALGPPRAVTPVRAGIWRVEIGGRRVCAKVGAGVVDEAGGLADLRAVAGVSVPGVVLLDADLLVTDWITEDRRIQAHSERLGRALAALHGAPWPDWGGGSGWIGACRVDNGTRPDGVAFYGGRLVDLAGRCGLVEPVERVVGGLDRLLPPGGPALLHGDLWWGNVLWGADGEPWLIDPSVHGGHPEEDLAMLALFGALPDHLLGAYAEIAHLADGWRERVGLFQLYPLLVHAVLFGGGYRSQAEATARRYL